MVTSEHHSPENAWGVQPSDTVPVEPPLLLHPHPSSSLVRIDLRFAHQNDRLHNPHRGWTGRQIGWNHPYPAVICRLQICSSAYLWLYTSSLQSARRLARKAQLT